VIVENEGCEHEKGKTLTLTNVVL